MIYLTFYYRKIEGRHVRLLERMERGEEKVAKKINDVFRKISGDVEMIVGEGTEKNDRLLETKLRTIISEERRGSLFTNQVRRSTRSMDLASNPRRRLFTGFSSEIFHSSTSSGSVFNHRLTSSSSSAGSQGILEDDDIIDLFESESLKIENAMNEIQRALENIKEKLGQGFSL